MLEAASTNLVSPSAWSAAPQIFSYPQAAGRLPHLPRQLSGAKSASGQGAKFGYGYKRKSQRSY